MHEAQKTATKLVQHLTKQSSSTLSKVAPKTIIRSFLLAEETYATVLLLIVVDRYGFECFNWSPETIKLELEEDYALKLPKSTIDKLMAAISVVTTNFFTKDVTKFIEICNIFSGDDFQPEEFEPADYLEVLWGTTEAILLWPPEEGEEDTQFSPEIREYVAKVLKDEGISKPSDVLSFAFNQESPVNIGADYADDPDMFKAIYEKQESKDNETKEAILEQILNLTAQLKLLPLSNGNTSEVIQRLQDMVNKADVAL